MKTSFYTASQDKDGGILLCELDENGVITQRDFTPLPGVAWLAKEGGRLCALLREPYPMQSGVLSFDITADGRLGAPGELIPTHGSISSHLLCRDGKKYVANYLSGTAVLLPDTMLAFSGSGPDERQRSSHPHCTTVFPSGDTLAITDLGADRIWLCSGELAPRGSVVMPAGSGPRHLVFSADGTAAYCSLELASAVAVLKREGEGLRYLRSVSTVPENYRGENSAAALRLSPDGKLLFVSNRGHGSVRIFRAEGTELLPLGYVECGEGAQLRETCPVGDFLLCADEGRHEIRVFRIGDGAAPVECSRFPVVRPWSILPADIT